MYLEILILALLREKPRHGYDLKKRVEAIVAGAISLNNNVLYPALRRFEQEGIVTSKLLPESRGPARRVFQLTARGREHLIELLEDFSPAVARDEAEFLTRVSFFDLVGVETRLDIIAARRASVEGAQTHLDQMLKMTNPRDDRWAINLLAFLRDRGQRELEWLERLSRRVAEDGKRPTTRRRPTKEGKR